MSFLSLLLFVTDSSNILCMSSIINLFNKMSLSSDLSQPKQASVTKCVPNMTDGKRKRAPFECVICMVSYKINIPHNTTKCNHSVCRECVRKYFNGTLQDNRYTSYEIIECPSPGCKEYFVTEEALRAFFSQAEIKRWWNSAILKAFVHNKVFLCFIYGCSIN